MDPLGDQGRDKTLQFFLGYGQTKSDLVKVEKVNISCSFLHGSEC
jgi:hypothetical protein